MGRNVSNPASSSMYSARCGKTLSSKLNSYAAQKTLPYRLSFLLSDRHRPGAGLVAFEVGYHKTRFQHAGRKKEPAEGERSCPDPGLSTTAAGRRQTPGPGTPFRHAKDRNPA